MAESSTEHIVAGPGPKTSRHDILRRIITSAIGIPVFLFIAIYGDILFLLAIGITVVVAGSEIARLCGPWLPVGPFWYVAIPAAGLAVSAAIAFPNAIELSAVLVASSFVLWMMALIGASVDLRRSVTGLIVALTASIYLGIGAGHLILLRSPHLQYIFGEVDGYQPLLLLVAVVWATDTAAYFVGKFFGSRPLAPHVSPNKTLEGGVAGLVAGGVVALLLGPFIGASFATAILVGLTVSVFAQTGDLVESLAKRVAGVKDSGALFPGHGGLLDRADSLIFASPALYYTLKLTGSMTS